MLPRLGEKFTVDIESISKPRREYQSKSYAQSGLPKAPAVTIDGEIIVEGRDINEQELEDIIRRRLTAT
ncbi:MAG TPA: hypothetical protein ENK33_12880 [Desulfobacterales bacterium]|nr:hypothetical protein [Desulfobacterales bacterium]